MTFFWQKVARRLATAEKEKVEKQSWLSNGIVSVVWDRGFDMFVIAMTAQVIVEWSNHKCFESSNDVSDVWPSQIYDLASARSKALNEDG